MDYDKYANGISVLLIATFSILFLFKFWCKYSQFSISLCHFYLVWVLYISNIALIRFYFSFSNFRTKNENNCCFIIQKINV